MSWDKPFWRHVGVAILFLLVLFLLCSAGGYLYLWIAGV
jgi:hypothetical protein